MARVKRSWLRLVADIKRQMALDAIEDQRMRQLMETRYQRRGY